MTYYNTKHTRKKIHIDGPQKSHRPQKKETVVTCCVEFERGILDDNHVV